MALNYFFPCNYEGPFTNNHELNLGWVLSTIKAQESELSKFVALNTVKYADPFDWNITTQYATNTVVFNPADMTAYLSVQPVPSGVLIGNTDYWTPIFTLSDIFTAYKTSITPVEQIAAQPATQALKNGQLLWIDNVLYAASRDIAEGTVIVPGENVLTTNISDELAAQEASITAEQEARVQADQQLQQNIQAEQTAREQADQALQEAIDNKTISLKSMTTTVFFYVDSVNGSDKNDGKSSDTAFKTIVKALDLINQGYTNLNIQIMSGGIYTVPYSTFDGIALHLIGNASGINVQFDTASLKHSIVFYNCHLNFSNITVSTADPSYDIYTENGTANFSDCVMNEWGFYNVGLHWKNSTVRKFDFRRGNGWIEGLTVAPFNGIPIDETPVVFQFGSIVYIDIDGFSGGTNTNANARALWIRGATVFLLCSPSNTSGYTHGIYCTYGVILVTPTRLEAWAGAGSSGNNITGPAIVCTDYTELPASP